MAGRTTLNRALAATAVSGVLVAGAASAFALREPHSLTLAGDVINPVSASIESPAGVRTAALSGAMLPVGARLVTTTASGSTASIKVGDRQLLLGANTSVVRDSDRAFTLERGTVIGAGEGGNAISLRSDETVVKPAQHSVWRVDRGFTTRIVSYNGRVVATTDTGATLTIDTLHQASAAGSALPQSAGPLSLTQGDARERAVAPTLVSIDAYLVRVAEGLDSSASHDSTLTELVDAIVGPAMLKDEPISERVLPALIAQATDANARNAYLTARALRADGGSWGVVAVLSGVRTIAPIQQAVAALVDLSKNPPPASPSASASSSTSSSTPSSSVSETPSSTPADSPSSTPTDSSSPAPADGGSTTPPTSGPTPDPTPTPTQDPGLVGGLVDLLSQLLGGKPKP